MLKRFLLLTGMSLTLATGLGLSSCSDDDDVLTEDQIRKIIADEVVKQSTGSDNSTSLTKEEVEKIVADYMVSHKTESLTSDDVKKIVDEIIAKQETGSGNSSSSLTKEEVQTIVADYMANHKTESLTSDDVKKIVDEIIAKQEAGSGNSDPKFDVTDDGYTIVPIEKLDDFLFSNLLKERELHIEISGVTNDNEEDLSCLLGKYTEFRIHLRISENLGYNNCNITAPDGNYSVVSLILPNTITDINDDGFWLEKFFNLKKIVIPSSVKSIRKDMEYYKCYSLSCIKFLGKVDNLYESSMWSDNRKLEKIEVPKEYVDYYKKVFPTFKDLIVGF